MRKAQFILFFPIACIAFNYTFCFCLTLDSLFFPKIIQTYLSNGRGVVENIHKKTLEPVHASITKPPTVITLPVTGVTKNRALLHARCNGNGQSALILFTVGIESTFNIFSTQTYFHAASDSDKEIIIPITELTPNTQYYTRVVAKDMNTEEIIAQGIVQRFTTLEDSDAAGIIIPIHIKNRIGREASLYFGVHTSATHCIDYGLGEYEMPPLPPGSESLVARFSGNCLGLGTEIDLRQFLSPTQIDTYNVRFQTGTETYPITVSWNNLSSQYTGQVLIRTNEKAVGMNLTSSLMISNVEINSLTIIAQHPRPLKHLPNIVTRPAVHTDATSTQITCYVNPNGATTSTWYEWGISTDYDNATIPQQIGDSVRMFQIPSTLVNLLPNTVYHYRAVAQNSTGTSYGSDCSLTTLPITDTKEIPALPQEFYLYQNYPNPFNPTTTISYDIPIKTHVSLKLFDILGREMFTLVDKEESRGNKWIHFDASMLSNGMYFYRLATKEFVSVKIMMIIK